MRRATTALLALQLPLVGAALVVAGEEEAGAVDLAAAADRTEGLDALRFEMTMSLEGDGEAFEAVMLRGEEVGDRGHMVMDMNEVAEAIGEPLPFEGDVGMEMFTDGAVLYLRAPMFAQLAGQLGDQLPAEIAPLAELGDRWGVVDVAASGASPEEIAALTGSGGLGIAAGLQLLRDAAGDLDPAGADEVHGTEVTTYEGTITFEEMLNAQGGDLSMLEGMVPADPGGLDPAALLDAMEAVELDFAAAVDDAGLVRRVAFSMDESFFEAVFEELDLPVPTSEIPDIEMTMAIELFDLDDPGITVELPVIEDPVDLGAWAAAMASPFGG